MLSGRPTAAGAIGWRMTWFLPYAEGWAGVVELREQFLWAVSVRWAAIAGFLALAVIAWGAGVLLDPAVCVVAAAVASCLNFLNAWAVRRWRLVAVATFAAIAGDVLLITFLAAQTGGIQSPFVAMYGIQVLAAAVLVEVNVALACAVAAGAALSGVVLSGGWVTSAAIQSPSFPFVWIAFFAFGLALVAYVGGRVARQLRRREHALRTANRRLRAALRSLEAGNRDLRSTCERLELTERQLAQSEKMRALGDFVAAIAHELNNPIAIVTANLELVDSGTGGGDSRLAEDALGDCREAARRAARIVAELRQFARAGAGGSAPRWQAVDLNQRVASTVRLARHLFASGVEVEIDLGDLPPLTVIAGEIDQMLLNLLSNAARAVGERGRVRISTEIASRDDDRVRSVGSVARRSIRIAVSDDGPGMEPRVRERIFEPFFTTRPEGQGVGLGLSLAFAIAERHGGTIRVASEPGRGARFEVDLPLEDSPSQEGPAETIPLDSAGGACG